MPRERPEQAPAAPNGQAYGARGAAIQSQQDIPLPRVQQPGVPQQQAASPGAQQQAGPPVDPMQAAIGYAKDFDPGVTPLTAPSQRPGEPVQTGLSMGPGAGPEIFSQPARANQAADVLTALAQASGNDEFLDMAARIRGSGGMR